MQLHSGHVTLLRTEFQPLNCPQSDLWRRAASRWALPHISSYFFSMRDLQGQLADRHKILPHAWKHVQFYNPGPKIWGLFP